MPKGPINSNKDKIHLNGFVGGTSIDPKYGIANSFQSSQALDFRQKASQMSVLPGFRQLSGNLPGLVTAMVQDPNGVRYGIDTLGNLTRFSTSGNISQIASLSSNGSAGIVYNQQSDQLYIPGQQTVSMYGQLLGTPKFRSDQFGPSASTSSYVVGVYDTTNGSYDILRNNAQSVGGQISSPSQVSNTLTNTYVLPSGILEATTNYCSFVPDIEPFYSVAVYVNTVGTGNWTLTMHDSLNNNLGSVTINNGSMTTGWNNFIFASQVRAIINGATTGQAAGYHFHLTSSVASTTASVYTVNANDLTGCNFLLFAYRLVKTNNGWHPMTLFGGLMCIGNGPYVSTYTFSNDASPSNAVSGQHGPGWDRHALSLDFGYEVCGLTTTNQYLVIAAEKRSKSATKTYQDGFLYFWDGTNNQYNFKIEIQMGAPYSVTTINNVVYFICAGSLFAWGGGTSIIKVRYIAYQNTDYLGVVDQTFVNPNMMDVRGNLLMIGYPSTTTNTTIPFGIYSWGSVELTYPNSFGFSYDTSLLSSQGINKYTTSNNLQIGMIKNFVDQMYMSWQYTDTNSVTHYGIDLLDNTSAPAANFSWQSLIWDGGVRYKLKKAMKLRINFLPLPSGTTLNLNYTMDRGAMVTADPATGVAYTASVGDTALTIELNNSRFHELQWGFSGTCTGATTAPTFTGVTLEVDTLDEERSIRQDKLG
jgi:hypothetical protein